MYPHKNWKLHCHRWAKEGLKSLLDRRASMVWHEKLLPSSHPQAPYHPQSSCSRSLHLLASTVKLHRLSLTIGEMLSLTTSTLLQRREELRYLNSQAEDGDHRPRPPWIITWRVAIFTASASAYVFTQPKNLLGPARYYIRSIVTCAILFASSASLIADGVRVIAQEPGEKGQRSSCFLLRTCTKSSHPQRG